MQLNYQGTSFRHRPSVPKSPEYSYSSEYITNNDIDSFSKIYLKRNGSVHDLLLFTRFFSKNNPNQPVTAEDIDSLNPKLFSTRTKLRSAAKKLAAHELIDYDPESTSWQITPKGIRFLYYFAKKNVKNN